MRFAGSLFGMVAVLSFTATLGTPQARADVVTFIDQGMVGWNAGTSTEANEFVDRSQLNADTLTFSPGMFLLSGFSVGGDTNLGGLPVLDASSGGTLTMSNNGSFYAAIFVLDGQTAGSQATISLSNGFSFNTGVVPTGQHFYGFISDSPLFAVTVSGPVNLVDMWAGPLTVNQPDAGVNAPESSTWLLTAIGLCALVARRKIWATLT